MVRLGSIVYSISLELATGCHEVKSQLFAYVTVQVVMLTPAGETPEVLDEPASKARLANVHLVDEEDLSKGTYSIEDVVLPLPGSQMKYPSHQTSKVRKSPR